MLGAVSKGNLNVLWPLWVGLAAFIVAMIADRFALLAAWNTHTKEAMLFQHSELGN